MQPGEPSVLNERAEHLGANGVLFEPPAAETALLGYEHGTLRQTVADSFAYYTSLA